jgi:hypothetical protein
LFGAGSCGDKQLKMLCGLSPLNTGNPKFGSLAGNVTVPSGWTILGVGDVARSQSISGVQVGSVIGTPSHSSTCIGRPLGLKPEPTIVNCNGFPAASPGTTNGLPVGVVIVPANATPATTTKPATAPTTTATNRRLRPNITKRSLRNPHPGNSLWPPMPAPLARGNGVRVHSPAVHFRSSADNVEIAPRTRVRGAA